LAIVLRRYELENVMKTSVTTIAVVRGASSAQVQDVFQMLAEQWSPSVRLAGLIAESHGLADRACSAGFLRNVASGERFSIFQDLGPGSTECHLDGAGALSAAEAVQRDVAAGCDLVLLSKFGKLEAGGKGLFNAFKAVIQAHIPLLTSVSPAFEEQWKSLAGRSFTILTADLGSIGAWWRAIRKTPAMASAAGMPVGADMSGK
jgi:hypothetical protein